MLCGYDGCCVGIVWRGAADLSVWEVGVFLHVDVVTLSLVCIPW